MREKETPKTPDTKVVVKIKHIKGNTKSGEIIDLKTGNVLFSTPGLPTFRHLSRMLRATGMIPANLVINTKGETFFCRKHSEQIQPPTQPKEAKAPKQEKKEKRKKNKTPFVIPEHSYRLVFTRKKTKGGNKITAKIIRQKDEKIMFKTSAPTWNLLIEKLKEANRIPTDLIIQEKGTTYF